MNSDMSTSRISIHRPSSKELRDRGVDDWEIWEKGPSIFYYHYDENEECYFLEGDVLVVTPSGEEMHIHAGDFVMFPKGLDCTWNITGAVRKHYRFS